MTSPTLPQDRIHDFVQYLGANGISTDAASLVAAGELMPVAGLDSRAALRRGLRACLTRNPEDFERFTVLFDAFFRPMGDPLNARPVDEPIHDASNITVASGQRLLGLAGTSEKQRQEEEMFGAGDFKALSLADFRFVFNPGEMRAIEGFVDDIARRARRRATRRTRVAPSGNRIDVRRTLRHSLAHEGHLVDLAWRRPARKPERFVLLLDISQSMDVYARLFMRFVGVLMRVFTESYAFTFNTELAMLGQGHSKLREQDFEAVMNDTGKGWLGGTRIAAAFEQFDDEHAASLLNTRTTLVVFSDGCDTAKPEQLAAATEKLRRRPRRLIWINPLLGRFEQGQENRFMDPVVPHVDRYLPAHSLESLLTLGKELIE